MLLSLTSFFDYAGVATFATSSAMVSRRAGLDLTATLLVACTAATGGGTLRDLLIQQPVFWVVDPFYVIGCIAAATCVWLIDFGHGTGRMIAVLEAIGVGCFAVAGSAKALHFDAGILASIIIGVLSATFGGIVSDALASRDTVLARKDIYVTAALVAALIYNVLLLARVPDAVAAIGGAASGASLRLVALRYGWLMPSPRGRKLRSGE